MQPDDVAVGIDVSKMELVIATHPGGERWTSATTPDAIDEVVHRLVHVQPIVVVVEATGGYEHALLKIFSVKWERLRAPWRNCFSHRTLE